MERRGGKIILEEVKNELMGLRNSLQVFILAICGEDKGMRTISIEDLEGVLKGYFLYTDHVMKVLEDYENNSN